jgi:peptidoglycan/xylan/chitin deacetylase (PgdA/CDA1 family)
MIALMYHDVVPEGAEDSSGFPGRDAALYKLPPGRFEAHLAAIFGAAGPAAPGAPHRASPAITFDDGGASAMRAADMLERHAVRGYFFITTDYIGSRGFVHARDLRDLQDRGHLIGSHSASHPLRLGHCSRPKILDEWTRSAAALADILGEAVTRGSVPGGDFAPQVAEAAADAGYTEIFTSEPTLIDRRAFGLALRGRLTIRRGMSPETAAALAAGDLMPVLRQAVSWSARKLGKRIGGRQYLALRKLLLGHDDEVRWGDEPRG